ncbi:restriction endonuclease [Shewanella acanthi]|nr:restriction endonuclease [Shewanella acanthi]
MVKHELYVFGASSPISVLRVTLGRHCINKSLSNMYKERYFVAYSDGTYALISKNDTEADQDAILICEEIAVGDYISRINELAMEQRERVKGEILASLRQLTPSRFEEFSQIFLSRYGFTRMNVTSLSRDGGIDVKGLLKIGLAEMRVAAQCKRYAEGNKVGRPDVSQFRGDITGDFEQGIFITTSTFTKEAQEISFKPGCVPIILIDGEQLADIMIDKGIGVQRQSIDVYDFEADLLFA